MTVCFFIFIRVQSLGLSFSRFLFLIPLFQSPSLSSAIAHVTHSSPQLIMPSNDFVRTVSRNFRVLVIGGSYGGLSAALALIDLSQGRLPRFNCNPDAKAPTHRIPIQITVVDKRDGYCKLPRISSIHYHTPAHIGSSSNRIPKGPGLREIRVRGMDSFPRYPRAQVSRSPLYPGKRQFS